MSTDHSLPRSLALLYLVLLAQFLTASQVLWGQTTEEEAALRALGYISHPPESAEQRRRNPGGLIRNTPGLTTPGYTLMTLIPESRAILVDNGGEIIRSWSDPDSLQWGRAELQPGGDLLVIGTLDRVIENQGRPEGIERREGQSGYLARYDWNGRLLWRSYIDAHHDLDVGRSGRIWTLGLEDRRDGDLFFQDHLILEVSAEGDLLREYSLFDALRSNPDLYELPRRTEHPKAIGEDGRVDLLHSNAIGLMPFPGLSDRGELYCASCVLVTVRHQNLVAIIHPESKRLVWAWGPGELQFPHEATWLENGHILIFDNGTKERAFSRIIEVEPRSGEIVWTYRHPRKGGFFSAGRGTAQALPGGNVLIASSNQSRVFEINRQGHLVWAYRTRGLDGRQVTVRAQKYPPTLLAPLIEGP
ncbi:MAG: arylsulfotransferase family protein [Acidobacteriota bacterium]